MKTTSVLLSGLRLNKALQECAPEECKALAKIIEKTIATAAPGRPPDQETSVTLAVALAERTIEGSVRTPDIIEEALTDFFETIDHYRNMRSDLNALCCAIALYRHRLCAE